MPAVDCADVMGVKALEISIMKSSTLFAIAHLSMAAPSMPGAYAVERRKSSILHSRSLTYLTVAREADADVIVFSASPLSPEKPCRVGRNGAAAATDGS